MKFEKFQETLRSKLTPIALKLESQRHLQAIKSGMVGSLPILIIGSFFLLPLAIRNLLPACGVKEFLTQNMALFTYATSFTTDAVSLFVAFNVANSLATSYQLNAKSNGITAISVQMILCLVKNDNEISFGYIGSKGIFVAMISAMFVVEITRIMRDKNMVIKMPKSVPPMVSDSMSALLPTAVSIIGATIISLVCTNTLGVPLPALMEKILSPLARNVDSLWFILIIVFFTQLLWFLGLHGQSIVGVIWQPFALQYAVDNAANFASGLPVEHIFTQHFYFTLIAASGSGLTIGLVILMISSKSEAFKAVGKVSLIPACFGINEPVIYGCPIAMNPYLCIPFIFGPVIVAAIDYMAIYFGLVGRPIAVPPGFMPPGVGTFLMTLDWRAIILVLITLILMTIFYYPFFKVMEAEELEKEKISN